MNHYAHIVAVVILAFLSAIPVSAQATDEPRATLQGRLKPGDKLTVDTGDGRATKGRFVAGRVEGLVLKVGEQEVPLAWADVDRVRRRRNGVLLGAIIGLAAGAAAAYPVYSLAQNETGDGAADALRVVLAGTAIGIGIDAVVSRNRTLYRRRLPAGSVRLEPRQRGAAVGVALAW